MTIDRINYRLPVNEVLRIIAKVQFRAMTPQEQDGFAGCETANPLIGEYGEGDEAYVVIIDGTNVQFHPGDFDEDWNPEFHHYNFDRVGGF